MNQGYCVLDGMYYFTDDEEAELLKLCNENGYKSLQEAFDDDFYYWTEWSED